MSLPLLSFQSKIIAETHDPSTSDLLILARGLGLRKIVCSLLKIYSGPQNLVLLVGANPDEDASIASHLSTMGVRNPGLRIVGYEMQKKERCVAHAFLAPDDTSERTEIDKNYTAKAGWCPSPHASLSSTCSRVICPRT